MRTNKKKLAALAMSAVMAASTMSFPVFADDFSDASVVGEAVVVEDFNEADVYEAEGQNVTITEGSVKYVKVNDVWQIQYTVTLDGVPDTTPYYAKATKTVTQKGTCDLPEVSKITGTSKWGHALVLENVITKEATGHDFTDAEEYSRVTTAPTCTDAGVRTYYMKCTVCKEEVKQRSEEIPADGKSHTWSSEIKTENRAGENTWINAEGKPELINELRKGTYLEVSYKECLFCAAKYDVETVTKNMDPLITPEIKYISVRLVSDGNIVTDLESKTYAEVKKLDPIKDIVLKDCTKAGKYQVVYWACERQDATEDNTADIVDVQDIEVPAHHTVSQSIEYKDEADKGMLAAKWDTKHPNFIASVQNKSCVKSIAYYVVDKCTECDYEAKSEEKIAEPSNNHVINSAGKALVENAAKAAADNAAKPGYMSKTDYLAFEAAAKRAENGLKVIASAACDADGAVAVAYVCDVCGKEIGDPVEIKVEKLGHDPADAVEDPATRVEPTCEKDGSFDSVVYCNRCKLELSRTKDVVIPALGHEYEKDGSGKGLEFKGNIVVDQASESTTKVGKDLTFAAGYTRIGYYPAYCVEFNAYNTCTVCGEKVCQDAVEGNYTITDVVKEDGKGNPGSITVNATWKTIVDRKLVKFTAEKTFDYFSSYLAYLEVYPDEAKNGLTLDRDGVFRYYEAGVFKEDYTGFVEYNNSQFYVENGVLASATGLKLHDDTFYYLSAGQLLDNFTGITMYNNEWFYVENGKLDTTKDGLIEYNGETFVIAAGRILTNLNGAWMNTDGTWYFVAVGRVATEYTGTTTYGGQTFNVENGKLVF